MYNNKHSLNKRSKYSNTIAIRDDRVRINHLHNETLQYLQLNKYMVCKQRQIRQIHKQVRSSGKEKKRTKKKERNMAQEIK